MTARRPLQGGGLFLVELLCCQCLSSISSRQNAFGNLRFRCHAQAMGIFAEVDFPCETWAQCHGLGGKSHELKLEVGILCFDCETEARLTHKLDRLALSSFNYYDI